MMSMPFPSIGKLLHLILLCLIVLMTVCKRKNIFYLYLYFIYIASADFGYSFPLLPIKLASGIALILMIFDSSRLRSSVKALIKFKLVIFYAFIAYLLFSAAFINGYRGELFFVGINWFLIFTGYFLTFNSSSIKLKSYALILIPICHLYRVILYVPTFIPQASSIILGSTPPHFYAAVFGAFLIAYCVTKMRYIQFEHKKGIWYLALIFSLLFTFLTGGRLQTAAGLTLIPIAIRKKKVAILAIVSIIIVLMFPRFSSAEWATERWSRLFSGQQITEIEFREKNVDIAFQGFKDSPIFGQGYGSWFQYTSSLLFLEEQKLAPHNTYMHILLELGCLGALIFLIMLFKFKIYLPWPRKQYLRQQSLMHDTFIYTYSGMLVWVLLIVGFGHGIIIGAYYLPAFLGMRAGAMQSLHRGKMLLSSAFTSITQ